MRKFLMLSIVASIVGWSCVPKAKPAKPVPLSPQMHCAMPPELMGGDMLRIKCKEFPEENTIACGYLTWVDGKLCYALIASKCYSGDWQLAHTWCGVETEIAVPREKDPNDDTL